MNEIKINKYDPHFDVVAWAQEKADAELMAEAHYRNAVITGKPEYKLAFFDSYHRAKQITQALTDYFNV